MLTSDEKKKVAARLRKIEGQVAGIGRMIEGDKYCVDVLLQLSAAQGALGRVANIVLGSHIDTCVTDAIRTGNDGQRAKKIDELMEVFSQYARIGSR